MSAPTPARDLRAAAVASLMAVAITIYVWPALYRKFRRDEPDGTESDASLIAGSETSLTADSDALATVSASSLVYAPDANDLGAYFDSMGVLEHRDFMTYDLMRSEMLNEVLKFIEKRGVDIPALRAQGLEVNAIVDEVMAVTNQHPRARLSDGTTSLLGRAAVDLVVRSEEHIKWERKMAVGEVRLTCYGEEYLASVLNARGVRRDGLIQCFDFLFGLDFWKGVTS
ncbi:hypothetical protein FA95DRAFT_1564215 [Auriscalpium vulgare]|uniref:Uncharacterized protein n=1 Tax=Auriscalpium vulgare TaxID=40419 RepID=A0ACB8REC8_9AGAM|nr:hypothetical protein FA95DRAFT_1564215 [Auriscalpium vulgare]